MLAIGKLDCSQLSNFGFKLVHMKRSTDCLLIHYTSFRLPTAQLDGKPLWYDSISVRQCHPLYYWHQARVVSWKQFNLYIDDDTDKTRAQSFWYAAYFRSRSMTYMPSLLTRYLIAMKAILCDQMILYYRLHVRDIVFAFGKRELNAEINVIMILSICYGWLVCCYRHAAKHIANKEIL